MGLRFAVAAAVALSFPAVALADPPPPADALPLSTVLEALEQEADFGHVEELEWDDGYWEVEYRTADGREVKVYLDPLTGEPR